MITLIEQHLSPTLSTTSFISSASWNQKSHSELITNLKNVYRALKEKERDLKLTVEIGNSLLENNLALKTNYEDLLNTPYPTPSNSYSLIKGVQEVNTIASQEEEEDDESDSGLCYIPTRTREALVEILEEKNTELSEQLELVLKAQTDLEKNHKRKACQLEKELEFLQSSFENATAKIQELEELKKSSQTKNHLVLNIESHVDILAINKEERLRENEEHVSRLLAQVRELQRENQSLNQSKVEAEDKLGITLHDLCLLKEQCKELDQTQEAYEYLKNAHEQQFYHSLELKTNLEEHETVLQKLSERGIRISSCFGASTIFYDSPDEDFESDDDDDDDKSSNLVIDDFCDRQTVSKKNLLTELEDAWFRHRGVSSAISSYPSSIKSGHITQLIQSTSQQFPIVNSAIESIYSRAQYVGEEAIDDALSLIGHLEDEYNHGKFLEENRHKFIFHPSPYDIPLSLKKKKICDEYYLSRATYDGDKGVGENRRIERYYSSTDDNSANYYMASVFMTFWKWCRFTLIMTMTIILSLRDGPRS